MPLQPITISDFKGGLRKDQEEFLLLNDAFPVLDNVYNWRGRLRRRDGSDKLGTSGRLRREITATVAGTIDVNSTPTATYNIFTALGVAATEPNAAIEMGSLTNIQVTIAGSAVNAVLDITTATQTFTITTAGTADVTAATLDYATGEIVVTHGVNDGAAQAVTLTLAYYPALPVMGLFQKNIPAINAEETVAFDTKYAYIFNGASDDWNEWIAGTTWSGSNSNFFTSENYWYDGTNLGLFWVTNFSGTGGDPMRYTNGVAWTNFLPVINGTNELHQCRFMVPYKGRLLAFNTYEGGTLATSVQYPQRLRYSQSGDPTDQTNGWLDDTPGRGGFIDASTTNEHILAYGFIRDQLIIGMERSIWAVRYTGNEILPFVWEKINSEFGWESMRSPVQFDTGVVGIGKKAVSVCNGTNVTRIDEEIPDEVFKIHNDNEGIERVAGIRDFDKELVYWCFSDAKTNGTFPDRLLVYNYRNQTWAFFRDSITALGEHQNFGDITWQQLTDETWGETTRAWNDAFWQAQYPNIIGGNQQGYVLLIANETVGNDPALQIEALAAGGDAVITSTNHNLEAGDEAALEPGDVVKISGILGTANVLNDTISTVTEILTANSFSINTTLEAGFTYFGGGEIERLSNFQLKSKKFNTLETGQSLGLSYIDFQTQVTSKGQFTCEILSDYSDVPVNSGDDAFFNTIVETNLDNSDEIPGSEKAYYRFYCNNHSRFSQFHLKLSEAQMLDETVNKSQVQIDNIILWMNPSGRATS
jgi:hypothetical protein